MIGHWFLRLAVGFALLGMGLGIAMGAAHDFTLSPVHAHVNLVGWTGFFLAGLFYRVVPGADGRLARVHFALATPGLAALATGIAGSVTGQPWGVPVAIAGSVLTLAGMVVFAVVVLRHTGRAAAASGRGSVEPAGRIRLAGIAEP